MIQQLYTVTIFAVHKAPHESMIKKYIHMNRPTYIKEFSIDNEITNRFFINNYIVKANYVKYLNLN